MKTTDTKQTSDAMMASSMFPFASFFQDDLVWSPYRVMCKYLLQSQHGAIAAMRINRKLADEMRDVIRHEQDIMDDIFERTLQRLSGLDKTPVDAGTLASQSLTDFYEAAMQGVRECGKAIGEAQAKSLELMREQAGTAAQAASESFEESKAV